MEGERGTSCDPFLVYVTRMFVCSFHLPWLQNWRWSCPIPPSAYNAGLNLVGDSRGRCFNIRRVGGAFFPRLWRDGTYPAAVWIPVRRLDVEFEAELNPFKSSEDGGVLGPASFWSIRFGHRYKQVDYVFALGHFVGWPNTRVMFPDERNNTDPLCSGQGQREDITNYHEFSSRGLEASHFLTPPRCPMDCSGEAQAM